MCGRYTVMDDDDIAELRQIIPGFRGHITAEELREPHLALPGTTAPVLTQHGDFMPVFWGFRKWDQKGVVFNARSETLTESGFFSPHLRYGRCIAPAREYFEWQTDPEQPKKKTKFRIYSRDNRPLFMGALMRPGENGFEFTIITRAASPEIAPIHHRMPLIFTTEDAAKWLGIAFDETLLSRGVGVLAADSVL